jgi:hypothetical protein
MASSFLRDEGHIYPDMELSSIVIPGRRHSFSLVAPSDILTIDRIVKRKDSFLPDEEEDAQIKTGESRGFLALPAQSNSLDTKASMPIICIAPPDLIQAHSEPYGSNSGSQGHNSNRDPSILRSAPIKKTGLTEDDYKESEDFMDDKSRNREEHSSLKLDTYNRMQDPLSWEKIHRDEANFQRILVTGIGITPRKQ